MPSGENATACTKPLGLVMGNVRSNVPVWAFHSLAIWSLDPVNNLVPSGEKATDVTTLLCPMSVRSTSPVCRSQSRAIQSQLSLWGSTDPVSKRGPSGENASEETSQVCPVNACRTSPVLTSQSRAVSSHDPVRM